MAGKEMGQMQTLAPGLSSAAPTIRPALPDGQGGPGLSGERPGNKGKKAPNIQRQVASKISMLSAKNAEILAWSSKVAESEKLSPG